MARLSGADFFANIVFFANSSLVILDRSTSARSGEDNRTVTIRFYYDGGIGVDAADGYNVVWTGVNDRGFFGGEARPTAHDFSPASPHAGRPGLDANGDLPAGAILIGGERYWLGSFMVTVPTGQTEETVYHGELQLTIS